jgi:hypothetical protein
MTNKTSPNHFISKRLRMSLRTGPINLLAVLIMLAASMPLVSCGRKGDLIPPGTLIPAQVMDLHAEPRAGTVVLAWTMPSRNTDGSPLNDLAGFYVMRAAIPEGQDDCGCDFDRVGTVDLEMPDSAVVIGSRVAWSDPGIGIENGRRYGYRVVPFNSGGYRGPESNTAKVTFLQPPPAPAGVAATPGNKSVELSWEEVTPGAPLAGYNIYRAEKTGASPQRPVNATPVAGTSYVDSGLANGTEYFYLITALAGSSPPYSESAPSTEVYATPKDTTPPEVPTGLQAVPSRSMVLLSWLPSVDADVAGYIVYRKGPGDNTPVRLGGMPVKGITWEDKDVEAGQGYSYYISAIDNASPPNESALSDGISVTVSSAGD